MKNFTAEIEKLEKERNATQALFNVYPEGIRQPDSICYHNSSLCEFSLTFKFTSLIEVVNLVKSWNKYILPLKLEKGTFTSFRTAKHKEDKHAKTSESVYPITVKVSKYGIEFEFYAMLGDHLISVDIKTDYGTPFMQWAGVKLDAVRDQAGNIIRKDCYLVNPAFHVDQRIKWGYGTDEGYHDFTLYWMKGNVKKFTDIFQPEFLNS